MPSPSLCDDSFFSSVLVSESDAMEIPVDPDSLALFASIRLWLEYTSSMPLLLADMSFPSRTLLSDR
jgi:hypothetical protein